MVEHGKSGLSFARMAAAARALDVSTDYLYGLTETPTPADRLARDLAVADPRYAVDDSHALADPAATATTSVSPSCPPRPAAAPSSTTSA